jgi:hypothetical protein
MSDRRGTDPGAVEGRLYAVDRIESPERGGEALVVLIGDDGTELQVRRAEFGEGTDVEDGAVYRVNPRALDWRAARRERGEEARRRSAGADAMARLRKQDPGGDLKL